MKDLIGKKFGILTVIEYVCRDTWKRPHWWKCKCECGNIKEVEEWPLMHKTKSCGCIRGHRDDLLGQKFNKLLVIEFGHWKKWSGTFWKCKCDCGKETMVNAKNLKSGWTTSCGCARNVCGEARPSYKGYGDISGTFFTALKYNALKRGIGFDLSIEYLWSLFTEQKGRCALSGKDIQFAKDRTASLDRIDSSKGYVVGNVQWLSKDVNFMKQSLSQDCFIELCREIVKQADEKAKQ